MTTILYKCKNCQRVLRRMSGNPLAYTIGTPIITCECGSYVNVSECANEWQLMAMKEKIRVVFEYLMFIVIGGGMLGGVALAILRTIEFSKSFANENAFIIIIAPMLITTIIGVKDLLRSIAESKQRMTENEYVDSLLSRSGSQETHSK